MNKTPQVFILDRVICGILKESRSHPLTETGAALIGVETKNEIVVLATLNDKRDIERYAGLFINGGSYQVELFLWYQAHWDLRRNANSNGVPAAKVSKRYSPPEKLNSELVYLGDWHKHPDGMTYLSGRDITTIQEILSDPEQQRSQLLSPLVTKYEPSRRRKVTENQMVIEDFLMTWFYTNHETKRPIGIQPEVLQNRAVPSFPPIPWYLSLPDRIDHELMYLRINGFDVTWNILDADQDMNCEIMFFVTHPTWDFQKVVTTKWNYPHSGVSIMKMPLEAQNWNEFSLPSVHNCSIEVFLVDLLLKEM